ncbi:hypothetical protein SAMN05443252_105405 [Bacillus sp. OV322]|uniref:hypothetical protein n=1 Tax=Bacillus sp. OV322 TaxID=1882764 RepID=UPI0008E9B5DB|nr:hypothetical protein [Bacillus sp. OV322]SFC70891.1 hypothetical protein SAMN05443252_105405 [Bacillus sp. OV322]
MRNMFNDYEFMELYKLQRQEIERKAKTASEIAERLPAIKIKSQRRETITLGESQVCLDCE